MMNFCPPPADSFSPEVVDFLDALQEGRLRAAHPGPDGWVPDADVKQRILHVFRDHPVVAMGPHFVDKAPLVPRAWTPERGVRVVPGGSSVRPGAHVAKGVILMPPSFINIGAFIGENTMIDSHVLVGSCAQIGQRVHVSAGVTIGGVLEPVGQTPVVVEDDAFLGAGCAVLEGVWVRTRSVIAPGVVLSAGTPIYDVVHHRVLYRQVPPDAVVIPGTRPVGDSWGRDQGLQAGCAIIIKYRDDKTDAALVLEDILRTP